MLSQFDIARDLLTVALVAEEWRVSQDEVGVLGPIKRVVEIVQITGDVA